jgi:methylmalonyl-CoA mutase
MPKLRIEEAAARTQARIDSGAQTIVGVNKYRLDEEDEAVEILEVDNSRGAREQQIARLERLRASATTARCRPLEALTEAASPARATCSALAVEAARAKRATVGEISDAWRRCSAGTRPRSSSIRGLQRRGGP